MSHRNYGLQCAFTEWQRILFHRQSCPCCEEIRSCSCGVLPDNVTLQAEAPFILYLSTRYGDDCKDVSRKGPPGLVEHVSLPYGKVRWWLFHSVWQWLSDPHTITPKEIFIAFRSSPFRPLPEEVCCCVQNVGRRCRDLALYLSYH